MLTLRQRVSAADWAGPANHDIVRAVIAQLKTVRQVAALPFAFKDGEIEVLLVTTRRRGRWIVPKGWPQSGCSLAESARREAGEEAGVDGVIGIAPLGSYRYSKRMRAGYEIGATVFVYPMLVERQRGEWAEKSERKVEWHRLSAAARLVDERGLARLIRRLSRDGGRRLRSFAADLSSQADVPV